MRKSHTGGAASCARVRAGGAALIAVCSALGWACSSPGVGGPSGAAGTPGSGAGGAVAGAAGAAGDSVDAGEARDAGGPEGVVCPMRSDASAFDAGDVDGGALAACEACELAHSTNIRCVPTLLTAMHLQDPNSGEDVAVGWGISTLSTDAERAAGGALLHCLEVEECATDSKNQCTGDNPVLGCFCGSAVTPVDCISGAGIHGPCLAAYAAAAAATPGGPGAGASMSDLALFVTTRAFDSSGPIGIADMVDRCGIAAPCPACSQL
jgi:hypothetical protein